MISLADYKEHLSVLRNTPGRIRFLLRDLPHNAHREKPAEDQFSILENVCHLRDIECEAFGPRISRVLIEDNPKLADVDGSRLAIQRNYNDQDLKVAMDAFVLARDQTIKVLTNLNVEQLARSGELEGVGSVTLGDLVARLREHDESHIEEIEVIRNRLQVR